MPEFIIEIHWRYGDPEFRCGDDIRHTRKILAGLKGRYPGTPLTVRRIVGTEDVTAEFI